MRIAIKDLQLVNGKPAIVLPRNYYDYSDKITFIELNSLFNDDFNLFLSNLEKAGPEGLEEFLAGLKLNELLTVHEVPDSSFYISKVDDNLMIYCQGPDINGLPSINPIMSIYFQ